LALKLENTPTGVNSSQRFQESPRGIDMKSFKFFKWLPKNTGASIKRFLS